MSRRDLFAEKALQRVPKLLTLEDRNPHSPTFGCFDRNYWHYRIIDFPSGMAQEMAWPVALAATLNMPNNPFYGSSEMRLWAEAGIRYAKKSAHRDGSCDDYFPYERAGGAASFSLLALVETYKALDLDDAEILDFFTRRADWLANFHESGQLTNHQTLIALALELMNDLLQTDRWAGDRDLRVERILDWQHPEGWFQEYEGFDPGYQTITISLLAWLDQLQPSLGLRDPIVRAVDLASDVMYPDGAYGGEIGSRNTYNYFPHGFEIVGEWYPPALAANDRFLDGLGSGAESAHDDDHHVQHHVWNYLLAWRDFATRTTVAPVMRTRGRTLRPDAGLLIERRGESELYLSLAKGGVFRLYREGTLVAADTQASALVETSGRVRNAVAHLVDGYDIELSDDRISVSGRMGWAKHTQMTTPRLMLLRVFMASLGRWFPNTVRRLLQRMLIVGKQEAPLGFVRTIDWDGDAIVVVDEITPDPDLEVKEIVVTGDQASIYVTMSRTYQRGQLQETTSFTRTERGGFRLVRRLRSSGTIRDDPY